MFLLSFLSFFHACLPRKIALINLLMVEILEELKSFCFREAGFYGGLMNYRSLLIIYLAFDARAYKP